MKRKIKETPQVSKLEEPIAAYGIAAYNPLQVVLGAHLANPSDFDLVSIARKGIAKKNLLALAKKLSLTIQEIADILHISERTLQRYTPSTLIKTEHADRAIELAKLYERGAEVLGSTEAFDNWLRHPNYALKNQVPFTLLDTSIGFTLVLDVLGRIEHGVFS
jgi:putative toxin-antitoxin system antitoxin component (TIGR02293 family)